MFWGCRKYGWGDTGIVLVFTGLQSAQPLFQLSAMLIRTINHILCVCLLSTNMGISGPWHHLQLSCSFVVNCRVFRLSTWFIAKFLLSKEAERLNYFTHGVCFIRHLP